MNYAIYSRKSKFTGTGDSVENQVQMCKEHLAYLMRDKEYEVFIYEDEGFSGKNLKRPMFQQLLTDIKNSKINTVVCYRLDRVSRNVSDFSQLLDLLQSHGVDFISIKESFDTSTPMGRAMISIASVFAQLERETIAERVKDNKLQIAKSGRWQGGNVPHGYKKELTSYTDGDGNVRKAYYLKEAVDSEDYKTAAIIFEVMKQQKSITRVESYLMQKRILTPLGNEYSNTVISTILKNPVYTKNAPCVYDYLKKEGCILADDKTAYDGERGLLGYCKTSGEKRKRTDKTDWVIAIGRHDGMISGEDWVLIQECMNTNKLSYSRLQTSEVALFSGVIKCSCGAPMLVKGNRPDKDGNPSYYYKCYRKDRSHGEVCNSANINGPTFDREIVDTLKEMITDNNKVGNDIKSSEQKLAVSKSQIQKTIFTLQDKIVKKSNEMEQLVLRLTKPTLPNNVLKIIETTLTKLSDEADALKHDLEEQNRMLANINVNRNNLELVQDKLKAFSGIEKSASITEKRDILKAFVKAVEWDGVNYHIVLSTDAVTDG